MPQPPKTAMTTRSPAMTKMGFAVMLVTQLCTKSAAKSTPIKQAHLFYHPATATNIS